MPHRRRRWAGPLGLAGALPWLILVLLASAARAQTDAERDPKALATEILDGSDYQTELPEIGAPVEARRAEGTPVPVYVPPALLQVLLYGALLVVVGLGVFWLVQVFSGYRRDAHLPARARAEGTRLVPLEARLLEDAESLAAEGRYAEAIHALLLRVLEALAHGAPRRIGPGLTSREVARALSLAEPQAAALDALVEVVEGCLFGHAAADRRDYESCLRGYQLLAEAGEGG